MKMKIVILILWCLVGFLIGRFIGLYDTKSSLDRGTYIEDFSPDKECEGGICPPEGWKDK